MSDTNINAYEAEVQEAEKAVAAANSNLEVAKQRLAEKKAELGLADEPSDSVETDGELVESPDKGVIGEVDPTHVPEPTTAPELPENDNLDEQSDEDSNPETEGELIVMDEEATDPVLPEAGDVVTPTEPEEKTNES